MSEFEYQYVAPRVEPSENLADQLAKPFEKLSAVQGAMAKQQADRAKQAATERNRQLMQLNKISANFSNWSTQDINEYQETYNSLRQQAMFHPNPEQFIPFVVQTMDRLEGAGNMQSELMKGQNSAYDVYGQLIQDPSLYRGEGTPIVSPDDLNVRRGVYHNHTVYGSYEPIMINGVMTKIGDYRDPSTGMTMRDMYEQRIRSEAKYDLGNGQRAQPMYETDSVTGVTTLSIVDPVTQQPLNKEPIKVSGPSWLHPARGERQWFQPETRPNYQDPTSFFATAKVQKLVAQADKAINDDRNPISEDQARENIKRGLMMIFSNDPSLQQSALRDYANETFDGTKEAGEQYDPEKFKQQPPELGWKTPMDLYLDRVVGLYQSNVTIPRSGSGGRAGEELLWANVLKERREGLPTSVAPMAPGQEEDYKLDRIYGNDADTMRGLVGRPRIDIPLPNALNVTYARSENEAAERISRIIPYYDDNIILVERVNADLRGKGRGVFDGFIGTEQERELFENDDYWNIAGWDKKPEPKFLIVPIRDDNENYSEAFIALEAAIREEYKKAKDVGQTGTPLQDVINAQE